jgi:hypothetical protein
MLSIFLEHEFQQQKNRYIKRCNDKNEFVGLEILWFIIQTIKTKKDFFDQNIDNNIFLTKTNKKFTRTIFFDAYSKYTTLKNKLIQYIHFKKKSFNTVDLCMNPFVNKRQIVYVIEKERKYTFHIHDISNIIVNALTYSDEYLFSVPNEVRNPYTNIKFTTEQLYIFYMCMQVRGFFIHPLFTFFMQENFVLNSFAIKYEPVIKEYIIDTKIKNFTAKTICEELVMMFESVTINNHPQYNQVFSNTFIKNMPKNILIHFKPLLYHYFRYVYSNNSMYRKVEYNKLIKKLIAFRRSNPGFIHDLKIQIPITKVNYKDICIPSIPSVGFIEALLFMQQN